MQYLTPNQEVDKMILIALSSHKCFDGRFYARKINEAREQDKTGKYYFWIRVANYQKCVKDLFVKLYRVVAFKTMYDISVTEEQIKEINILRDKLSEHRSKFIKSFDTKSGNTFQTSINSTKYALLTELVECEGLTQMMYFNIVSSKKGKDYFSNSRSFNQEIKDNFGKDEMTDLMLYDRFCNFFDYVGTEFFKYDNRENKSYGHLYSTFDLVDLVSKEFGGIEFSVTGTKLSKRAKSVTGEKEKQVLKFLSIKPLLDALFKGRKKYITLDAESRIKTGFSLVEPFAGINADGKEYIDVFKSNLLQERIKLTGIEKSKFTNSDIYSAIKSFIKYFKDIKFGNEYFDSQLDVYLKNATTLYNELQKDKEIIVAQTKQTFEGQHMTLPKSFGEDVTNYNDI